MVIDKKKFPHSGIHGPIGFSVAVNGPRTASPFFLNMCHHFSSEACFSSFHHLFSKRHDFFPTHKHLQLSGWSIRLMAIVTFPVRHKSILVNHLMSEMEISLLMSFPPTVLQVSSPVSLLV